MTGTKKKWKRRCKTITSDERLHIFLCKQYIWDFVRAVKQLIILVTIHRYHGAFQTYYNSHLTHLINRFEGFQEHSSKLKPQKHDEDNQHDQSPEK